MVRAGFVRPASNIAYATFAVLNDGMDVKTLAIQMGSSIHMIKRHYSHLTPRLRKDMLTGKRYEMLKDDYRKQYDVTSHASTTVLWCAIKSSGCDSCLGWRLRSRRLRRKRL